MPDDYVNRHRYYRKYAQLENERSTFVPHWRDLNDYILPRRGRFFTADSNRGERRSQRIIDSTATSASRTLQAGMMSGITSPARPWFRLKFSEDGLNDFGPVKQWLSDVEKAMNTAYLRSNLYNVLPTVYGDIGTFGTGCVYVEEDLDTGVRFYPFPIGSYFLAQNNKLEVDTFLREFRMTARQVIGKFATDPETGKIDFDKLSPYIKNLHDNGNSETWIDVCHLVEPNENYDPSKTAKKFKKFKSVYYEKGTSGSSIGGGAFVGGAVSTRLLSESGYDIFPVLAPRWEVTGEDVYGTNCPGMVALGDVRQLQTGERRAAQALEKMVNPPMVGPISLRNAKASILPGNITYVDDRNAGAGFRPAHQVDFRVDLLEQKQEQIRQRIKRAYFEDLFLMISQSDRRQFTATEINERREEKLLAIGPVLEQLNQDMLDPLTDITFSMLEKQNKLPPPPEEIQGRDLKVEYISIMAQAQKVVGLGGIERFSGFVGNLLQLNPESADKLDLEKMIDVYGDLTSIPAGIVRPDEEVEEIRTQRRQAEQQRAEIEAASQGVQNAKALSETDTSKPSALTALAGGQGGA